MNIASLYSVTSDVVRQSVESGAIGRRLMEEPDVSFESVFQKAMDNINTTNSYLSDYENEEIRWALGETENTHDLTIAMNKAATALQYTVAIRDKALEAYREIMQMQI